MISKYSSVMPIRYCGMLWMFYSLLIFFISLQHVVSGQQKDSLQLQISIDSLSLRFSTSTNQEQYHAIIQEAISIQKNHHGSSHFMEYDAKLFLIRANCYFRLRTLSEGEAAILNALSIYEKLGKNKSLEYVKAQRLLGVIYVFQDKFDLAFDKFTLAKNLTIKHFDEDHPIYTQIVMNIASLYWKIGNHHKSLEFFKIAEEILLRNKGPNNVTYASLLINLGALYKSLGRLEDSLEALHKAKKIVDVQMDPNHPHALNLLTNLGGTYFVLNDLDKADYYLNLALQKHAELNGTSHPSYLSALNRLGLVKRNSGEFDKALEICSNFDQVCREKDEPYSFDCLGNLVNWSYCLEVFEQTDEAKELLYRVIHDFENRLENTNHSFYNNALNNLGSVFRRTGEYDLAELYHLKALYNRDTLMGKSHPLYLSSSYNLASLYINQGKYEKAQPYIDHVMAHEHDPGANSSTIPTLNLVAKMQFQLENIHSGQEYLSRYFERRELDLMSSRYFMSEGELENFTSVQELKLANCASLVEQYHSELPALTALLYDQTLLLKAFILNELKSNRYFALQDSASYEILKQLRTAQRKLSDYYSKSENSKPEFISEKKEEIARFQKKLARNFKSKKINTDQVRWKDMRDRLLTDEAAIEFVSYRRHDNWVAQEEIHYAAIILKPKMSNPQFVFLTTESQLEQIMDDEYTSPITRINESYKENTDTDRATLTDLVWSPISKHLKGVKKIYFSPAGRLHQININALFDQGELLCKKYELIQLISTQNLPREIDISTTDQAYVYGGIDFDDNVEHDDTINDDHDMFASDRYFSSVFKRDSSVHSAYHWDYLPSTQTESDNISKIIHDNKIDVTSYRNKSATEASYYGIGADHSNIIHFATHGFFLDKINSVENEHEMAQWEPSPLSRSGLVFAGANGQKKYISQYSKRDGILTAYEISQTNLHKTELVVLSACETGLGEINGSEGVYGLQRAFRIAGVNKIIMSLWHVPDYHTRLLMTKFYSYWLSDGLPVRKALLLAQLDLREMGEEPFYWAGFVLLE